MRVEVTPEKHSLWFLCSGFSIVVGSDVAASPHAPSLDRVILSGGSSRLKWHVRWWMLQCWVVWAYFPSGKTSLSFHKWEKWLIPLVIHATMCSAIDFPLYMSHDLFSYKSGRRHAAAGGLVLQYECWLLNNTAAPRATSLLYVLLFGRSTSEYGLLQL